MQTPNINEAPSNLLDVFLPDKIIENLKEKVDCTKEITEMILSIPVAQLKKLASIFIVLENYEMEKIIEITTSKTRFQRYNSTFLVFSWIKQKFLNLNKVSEVEAVYETVFVPRFRDIDPSIRAMCVQFLCDWAMCSKTLCKVSYLKYFGYSLNDRNDSVRRKALKSIFKISKLIKKKDCDDVVLFLEKYKSRLLEIALKDINPNLQKEGCRAVLCIYLKNTDIFTVQEITQVISMDSEISDLKFLIFKKLCPDGIWDLDALHRLLYESNSTFFKNMKLSNEDTNSFILNVIEYIKNRSSCCGSKSLCFLNILKELKITVDPIIFIDLLNCVKDNSLNVKLVVSCLSSVSSFLEYPASTFKILDYLASLVNDPLYINSCAFIEEFIVLLKKLEDDFTIQIIQIIDSLKMRFTSIFIKHFDISDDLNNSHSPVTKCYGALWKIMKGDYHWVNSIEFKNTVMNEPIKFNYSKIESNENKPISDLTIVNDTLVSGLTSNLHDQNSNLHDQNSNLEYNENQNCSSGSNEYLELVDFLVFLIKKIPFNTSTAIENSSDDPLACAKLLFEKLSAYISSNFAFNDEYSCLFLFKLISLGHFTCFSKTLFQHCSEETLKNFIGQTKDFKTMILGYFDYLINAKNNHFVELSKILGAKVSKTDPDRYVFSNLKRLISRAELLDSVLINFVPSLNIGECIVIENLVSKSKMKTLLLRKCKYAKSADEKENVTFI